MGPNKEHRLEINLTFKNIFTFHYSEIYSKDCIVRPSETFQYESSRAKLRYIYIICPYNYLQIFIFC